MCLYPIVLPLALLIALPGWILKMLRRGGGGDTLAERAGVYRTELAYEPCGAVHIHAISVGEALLALRLIREWRDRSPDARFVLATGTATGHAVARAAAIDGVRITYAPLDLPPVVHSYFRRFEPSALVLVEGEVWPNLMKACQRRGIPVSLVNARMSPRSERRYRRFATMLRPLFSQLALVALQEEEHRAIWEALGVPPSHIHRTGSLKFDPGTHHAPTHQPSFQQILDSLGDGPVLLAASTHPGEEVFLAHAMRDARPEARRIVAPRHAERAAEVERELLSAGHAVVRRSAAGSADAAGILIIDTTGELRDWTAHADVAIVGKSFLSHGGQNPVEAILAGTPVVFGPHMENFQPLAGQLVSSGGALLATDPHEIITAIHTALDPERAQAMTTAAQQCLLPHRGAIQRVVALLLSHQASSRSTVV